MKALQTKSVTAKSKMLSNTVYSPRDEEFENSLTKLFCTKTHVWSAAFQDATSKEECSRNPAWVDHHINLTDILWLADILFLMNKHMWILLS
jgi:hypothetical protein